MINIALVYMIPINENSFACLRTAWLYGLLTGLSNVEPGIMNKVELAGMNNVVNNFVQS